MSQIKFRALIGNDLMFWDLQDMCGPHRFSMRQIICPWLMEGNQPDRFTGLQDKNGADIFEGDIVKVAFHEHGHPADYEEHALVIIWSDEDAMFVCRDISGYESDLECGNYIHAGNKWLGEVVANIHQHPALLPEATS